MISNVNVSTGIVFMLLDDMLEQDASVGLAVFVLARLGSINWDDHQKDNVAKEGHGF